MNWPAPHESLRRMYHALFGWGRVRPFSQYRQGTLFYPEQAVEWNTAAPPMPYKRDRVEVNEPVFIRDTNELKETYEPSDVGHLLNIALQVVRFPCVSDRKGSEAGSPTKEGTDSPEERGPKGDAQQL